MNIYKYPLEIAGTIRLHIPKGRFKILKIAEQDSVLCAWVAVYKNDSEEHQCVEILVRGTGDYLVQNYLEGHLDTVLCSNGLVWHFFLGAVK